MILCIADVLTPDEISTARNALDKASFVDGKISAGAIAGAVKSNEEADGTDATVAQLAPSVAQAIFRNAMFQIAVLPKTITSLMFSRYGEGMAYGKHVDAPRMGGARADVSFTLFLNDPADYDGGELMIEQAQGELPVKLNAGQMVTYPSTTLHQVAPVTRGRRLCAVGWVRSLIRDPAAREILYDLEVARNMVFERHGPVREVDLLMKCILNLQRRWMDD